MKPKNPWISILTKPKSTIRKIVDFNPNYRLLILSWIYGFYITTSIAQNMKFLISKWDLFPIVVLLIILAPIFGYLSFSIFSWFVFKIGKWIDGKGSFKEIRASIAWATVPLIVNVLISIFFISFFKKDFFIGPAKEYLVKLDMFLLIFIALLIQITTIIWFYVIYFNALAEVQKFSVLKAFLNVFLTIIILGILSLLLIAIFKWTCSTFFDEPIIVNFLFK
ncbi:MAG: hypothetical protein AMS24_03465 [Chlamydiae bacterium SM23_39]|nr:MAG: hypothetical protein AMS24_03465 [Chlamydiae bacterium SM23_39]